MFAFSRINKRLAAVLISLSSNLEMLPLVNWFMESISIKFKGGDFRCCSLYLTESPSILVSKSWASEVNLGVNCSTLNVTESNCEGNWNDPKCMPRLEWILMVHSESHLNVRQAVAMPRYEQSNLDVHSETGFHRKHFFQCYSALCILYLNLHCHFDWHHSNYQWNH
uniref:Uncharacterized protein n=1 Tax=Tetranychus urticae TaxID=32264 RepID=T1KZP0_TETUR